MKCDNCGKKINSKNTFCPHCGTKIEIKEEVEKTPKKKKQIFKIIVMIIVAIVIVFSAIFFNLMYKMSLQEMIELMFSNPSWLTLNILCVFLPTIYVVVIYAFGWIGVIVINVICIILSGLTMIKASKNKKIVLGIFIIASIIIICFALLKYNEFSIN